MAAHTVQRKPLRIRTIECSHPDLSKHVHCKRHYPGAVCSCPCHDSKQLPLPLARAA